jgi:uncharacterized protein YukE
MSEIIKMDYPAMEEMADAFKQGADTLEDVGRDIGAIAALLEGGAMLGVGGDAWSGALNQRLLPKINKLRDKLSELQGDIWGALVDLRDGDHESQSRFKG